MAVKSLKSLVLCGISVPCDGQAVSLRLGFSYPTASQLQEIPISLRPGSWPRSEPQPERGCPRATDPRENHPEVDNRVVGNRTHLRAGRSVRYTGVLCPITPTTIGGRARSFTWSWATSGASAAAAAISDSKKVWAVASGAKTFPEVSALPGCLADSLELSEIGSTRKRIRAKQAWNTCAGRTLPDSTRGHGV